MHFTAPAFVAAANFILSASAAPSDSQITSLLRRQEPGTSDFACHSSCGSRTAISIPKKDAQCENEAFLAAYAEYLACADVNIWKYYGASVGAAGERCGLSTTSASSEPVEEKSVEVAITSAAPEPAETQAPVERITEVPKVSATEAPVAEEASLENSIVQEVIEATSTLEVIVPIATPTGVVVVPNNGTASPTGATPFSPTFAGAAAANTVSGDVVAATLAAVAAAL